jgi:tripartite-type tricarboxylate transporter receptor subunit TctC
MIGTMPWKRRIAAAMGALALLLPLASLAQGDAYPSRPVKVVVPFPAGGVVDIIARLLGDHMARELGQPFVIENKVGAVGSIGTATVAHADADGYTLLLASPSHTVNVSLYKNLPWDPIRDFAPIAMVGAIPNVVVVHPSVPAKTLAEFVTYAKARPGELNFGSAGSGSTIHLATEMLQQVTGIKMTHIPYKGQPQAVTALIAGEVQMMTLTLALAKSNMDAGKMRGLAVTSKQRVPGVDLPTVAESGYPSYEVSTWFGYLAPDGTPQPIVDRLNEAIRHAVADKGVQDRLHKIGMNIDVGTPREFGDFLKADVDRWAKVVRQAGVKVE